MKIAASITFFGPRVEVSSRHLIITLNDFRVNSFFKLSQSREGEVTLNRKLNRVNQTGIMVFAIHLAIVLQIIDRINPKSEWCGSLGLV